MTESERQGSQVDARRAMLHHFHGYFFADADVSVVGSGEDRTAYRIGETVYKVGDRQSANVYDHEALTAAREAGMPWAPATTLYRVTGEYGDEITVLAMPYLADDGSEPDPAALAEMHTQTGGQVDRLGGNYVVISGCPIVVDGCTVEGWA